jgi:deoxyribodipyrimidine photo-lyase
MTTTSITVMLFHRDLRIIDHRGLAAAAKTSNPVLPLFIFTPQQVTRNTYKSMPAIQFMLESLEDLDAELRTHYGVNLTVAYGNTIDVLSAIHRKLPVATVVETADYTPFAKQRTAELGKWCEQTGAEFIQVHDTYLLEPGSLLNKSGKTFQKFTPFYETARVKHIDPPITALPTCTMYKFSSKSKSKGTRKTAFAGHTSLERMFRRLVPVPNSELATHGGRKVALELLKHLPSNYAKTHDIPSISTSMLSAHNHFGTVSIREVYAAADGMTEFRRQLWWRDFYGHLMNDFETLYGVNPYEFQAKWTDSAAADDAFEAWKRAKTGVPLVDAGMTQLLKTGYIHNRVRLAVSSWLVKEKHVHWRRGERFFAQHLVDYDPAQNMMNWIWVSSALPFASAPFRRVDPVVTARRFDPDNVYINTWIEK